MPCYMQYAGALAYAEAHCVEHCVAHSIVQHKHRKYCTTLSTLCAVTTYHTSIVYILTHTAVEQFAGHYLLVTDIINEH